MLGTSKEQSGCIGECSRREVWFYNPGIGCVSSEDCCGKWDSMAQQVYYPGFSAQCNRSLSPTSTPPSTPIRHAIAADAAFYVSLPWAITLHNRSVEGA